MSAPSISIQMISLNTRQSSILDTLKDTLEKKQIEFCNDENGLAVFLSFDDTTDIDDIKAKIKELKGRYVILLNVSDKSIEQVLIWDFLSLGVEDVLNLKQNNHIIETLLARLNRWAHIKRLMLSTKVQGVLAGNCPQWQVMIRNIIEVAVFSQAPILIMGETGTGKEVVANLIHNLDIRSYKENLILLDCASIVPELSGSEFFGHEKGAFTNAIYTRDGAFALADNGTLFLDEIGELPLNLQADLLRVLQEGIYKRVGSNTWKKTHFRLICATNRDLEYEVKKKRFREDLYYRLSTWVFKLPPLRERRMDIPDLTHYFLKELLANEKIPAIENNVMSYLQTREYNGNIRELKQVVSRIATRHIGSTPITIGDIAESDRPHAAVLDDPLSTQIFKNALQTALDRGLGFKEIMNDVSNIVKDIAINKANGNLQIAAQSLNVTDRTLQQYIACKKGIGQLNQNIGEA